ncbi:Tyrosine-protein phosphatase domain-containing protein [Penicillium ucsense]|uniref:Tyrosine-protein phosphatase domain-containing protein n=1 Tax=Penicillium ucsense TaxID=2839758 RepID=A0A8J8VYL0_9EURO|nr:Tyrosine-protein phosphatase domain-containing protein [Penicillium ucsense]KAF7732250.1 Tyrosine-protein phosphatase domain-containing protein [Penicillium ucsense]
MDIDNDLEPPQVLFPQEGRPGPAQLNDAAASAAVMVNTAFTREGHVFTEGEFVSHGFFELFHFAALSKPPVLPSWRYEMRRVPHDILPFLSLGPLGCLRENQLLQNEGFTLLLGIRSHQAARAGLLSGDKAARQLAISADTVDFLDNQGMISLLPRAIRRINDHLAGLDDSGPDFSNPTRSRWADVPKKVLVFCETGNDRSALVVIAYLMVMLNLTAAVATDTVQQIRPSLYLSEEQKSLLRAFESILTAKRDVERASRANRQVAQRSAGDFGMTDDPSTLLSHKRTFSEHQGSEPDLQQHQTRMMSDLDGSIDRRPPAPSQSQFD